MPDGFTEGLIIGLIICAIIAILVVISSKKREKKLAQINRSLPLEVREKLTEKLLPWQENRNFLIGNSYVYDVKPEGNLVKICVYFRHESRPYAKNGDYDYNYYAEPAEIEKFGIVKGSVITTIHNSDEQYRFSVSKIIGRK